MDFPRALRERRTGRHLSQLDLALRAGTTQRRPPYSPFECLARWSCRCDVTADSAAREACCELGVGTVARLMP
nr:MULTISPECIES: hypothetical protein [unclassified Frankia]